MEKTHDGKRIVIALYPTAELKARLQQYALAEGESMGQVAMRFIEQGLDQVAAPKPARQRRSLL